jgi:hypothetical protein
VVELAEIFRRYGPQYRAKFADKMLSSHRQAMRTIEQCRTPALGGHVYVCEACGETQYQYHSCRNRHCPKCQNDKAQRWLEQQQDLLLPVPYFLLTFTLPGELRGVARSHQKRIYDLLFRTSAAAVQHLARDPRFVGGQVDMVGVLHTWGRNLSYHPHVHYLVPAGGLAADGAWLPARKNFLLPVKALSRIFRAKFRDALRRDCSNFGSDSRAPHWDRKNRPERCFSPHLGGVEGRNPGVTPHRPQFQPIIEQSPRTEYLDVERMFVYNKTDQAQSWLAAKRRSSSGPKPSKEVVHDVRAALSKAARYS